MYPYLFHLPLFIFVQYSFLCFVETESTPYVIKTSEESNEDEKQTAYYNALNTWVSVY